MIKYLLKIGALVFCLFIFNTTLAQSESKVKHEYPSEWMYNQRAYPTGTINKAAIKNATKQVIEAKNKNVNKLNGSWEQKGPLNIGGRITDIAISPDNDNHFYIGTSVGGVFKTTDRGQTWSPIFDGVGRPSIGNLAVAPTNAQRIYVGTGEANASAGSGAFFGDGMYRSDDGGQNWSSIGLPNSEHIARIQIDPNNQDRLFVAATGVLYGKNDERGVYRSIDGGDNWEQVLFVSDSTACIDLIMHPENPNILLAAFWERVRYPWVRDYAGVTSGVYRSEDGGETWTLLANGLPAPDENTGRIGLTISRSGNSDIYASYTTNQISNTFDKLFKSSDLGITWEEVNSGSLSSVNSSFGWFFGNLRIHPTEEDEVFVLGQQLYKSNNNGNSWNNATSSMHVDFHAMDFSWTDPDMMLIGTDGGLYISENGGNSWSHFENLPITQFYNIEVDEQNPETIFGGAQDNNTLVSFSGDPSEFEAILGGDGFHVNVDPNASNIVYAEYQFGNLFKSTNGGVSMNSAVAGIDGGDRNNWNTPVVLSPFNSEIVYYGSNKLYQSNQASFWNAISDDLTHGQFENSNSFATLTTIAPSYTNLDVIYTGSDDGRVAVTFDGGDNWEFVDAQLPNRYVTRIAIDPSDDLMAYVTFSGYKYGDVDAHVYKTTDGGQNWSAISSNLPNIPVNEIVIYESEEERLLIIANDLGVWYSSDEGDVWSVVGDDLPMTIVMDLRIHKPTHTLYAGTFGRSIYSIDLNEVIAGVNEMEQIGEDLFAYPIPVNDILYVKTEGTLDLRTSAVLTDIKGSIVGQFYPSFESYNKLSFDLTDVANGTYFLKLKSNVKYKVIKVVVQH